MAKQVSYTIVTVALVVAIVVGALGAWLIISSSPASFVSFTAAVNNSPSTTVAPVPASANSRTVGGENVVSGTEAKATVKQQALLAIQLVKDLRFTNSLNGAYAQFSIGGLFSPLPSDQLLFNVDFSYDLTFSPNEEALKQGVTDDNFVAVFQTSVDEIRAKILQETGTNEISFTQGFFEAFLGNSGSNALKAPIEPAAASIVGQLAVHASGDKTEFWYEFTAGNGNEPGSWAAFKAAFKNFLHDLHCMFSSSC